jgi:hypothetical protein
MARTLELDTLDHPGNTGTANIVLSSDGTTTMPVVNINGGAIDSTAIGAQSASSIAATTITATTLDTGQGPNELYDMDQNVKTDSTVSFGTISSAALGSSVTYPTGHLISTKIYQDDTGIGSSSVNNATAALTDALAVSVTSGNTYTVEFSGTGYLGWYSSTNEQNWSCECALYEGGNVSRYSSSPGTKRRSAYFGYKDIAGTAGEYGGYSTFIRLDYSFTAASTTTTYFVFGAVVGANLKFYLQSASSQDPYCYIVREYQGDNLYSHGTNY